MVRMRPQFVFIVVGAVLLGMAILVDAIPDTPRAVTMLLLNVGVSVLAVSIVDLLWRKIGGEPIAESIRELKEATRLLKDLDGTGVRRIHAKRVDWEKSGGKERILKKMREARQVDLMGIALQRDWVNDPEFQDLIAQRAHRDGCRFRVMIFDPDSSVAGQRAKEEAAETGGEAERMRVVARSSLSRLDQIRQALDEEAREFLELRVIHDTNLYCATIRADGEMLVTHYFYHVRGSQSPCWEVEGDQSSFFAFYGAEFERMWKRGATWPPPIGGDV